MNSPQVSFSNPIHVWHATSSSAQPGPNETCCHAWLDDSELERAARFRHLSSRNQHVVGRGMARRLLGGGQFDPRSIQFNAEVHGKPYVVHPDAAKRPFNVAHTDGLVICGIGNQTHRMLGIDVERLNRRTDPGLAERYFSVPEVRYLQTYRCETERRNAFLRIWTLKESFIKAIGTGLQTPLADFAFEEIESDSPTIRMLHPSLESDAHWKFFSMEPRPGFIAAIAVATDRKTKIDFQLHSFDDWVALNWPN